MDMVAELIIKYDRENNIVWGSEELPENCDYLYEKQSYDMQCLKNSSFNT